LIARVWRGVVALQDADVYADYIRETGFNQYAQTAGNRGAWLLRRDEGDRTEFITYSLWDSVDSIRAFAGDDIERAVYYPEDERYLVQRDDRVAHYSVEDHVAP
jgi:heme-degrading monooxygenase HmoA